MTKFDVVVVGAGHNGLTAACYLARAGKSVCVLERSDIVGGAAVTQELMPGFYVSTASYSLSLLRPDIYRDLELERYGLKVVPKDPQMFVPLPQGRGAFIWRDASRTAEEIERIHPADVEGYRRFNAFWDRAVGLLRPLIESVDPPSMQGAREVFRAAGAEDVFALAVESSAAEVVSTFFESTEMQGMFASQGLIGTDASVDEPGTAFVMAFHLLGGEIVGADGTWAYVEGGMGSVTRSLLRAAEELGVTVITNSAVERVMTDRGAVSGVVTDRGSELQAKTVLSNAAPHSTFALLDDLPGEVIERLDGWRYDGPVVKVNLALGERPRFVGFEEREETCWGTVEVSPSLEYLRDAYEASRDGVYPDDPFMEVFIQSATDRTLAPEGKHVVSAFTQYAPHGVDADVLRRQALDKVIAKLGSLAPNIPGSVLASQALGPQDLEARFALPGGDIFHGTLLPPQVFGDRWPYRTGIPGLYMCGSSCSPGGGVMGAAGRNAAAVTLRDMSD